MKSIVALLVAATCIAAPCAFAADRFTSDKPTPLKRLEPGKNDGVAVRFSGSVQLAGQFFLVAKQENGKPVYRRITFYPDPGAAALLPHPVDQKPVAELDFTNRAQAGAMLRDLVTVEMPLAGGQTGSAGAATVTIRNYQTVIECDHRWYLAELVSVVKKDVVASARPARPGC